MAAGRRHCAVPTPSQADALPGASPHPPPSARCVTRGTVLAPPISRHCRGRGPFLQPIDRLQYHCALGRQPPLGLASQRSDEVDSGM
ncbi:hypothetical protein U9M48_016447 [Paspalum notatum var. saurae]|uniref:Uncharacterized protein n=1 Tax=Paspalum notatum var. saurae TaxID=547442 RepID=A0AAQ3WN45_PASNO